MYCQRTAHNVRFQLLVSGTLQSTPEDAVLAEEDGVRVDGAEGSAAKALRVPYGMHQPPV